MVVHVIVCINNVCYICVCAYACVATFTHAHTSKHILPAPILQIQSLCTNIILNIFMLNHCHSTVLF